MRIILKHRGKLEALERRPSKLQLATTEETHLKDNLSFQVEDNLFSLELGESKTVRMGPFVTEKTFFIFKKYMDVFI